MIRPFQPPVATLINVDEDHFACMMAQCGHCDFNLLHSNIPSGTYDVRRGSNCNYLYK